MTEPRPPRSPVPSALGEALRDRFFTLSQRRTAPGSDAAEAEFRAAVDAHDPDPIVVVQGLGMSYHPTSRFKAVRFVESDVVAAALRDPADLARFARPHLDTPELVAVFVDPEELSFRTFENIVPLDRWFARSALHVDLGDLVRLDPSVGAFTLSVRPDAGTTALLTGLDGLDLYVPPLNAGSRGGVRAIFHSALLAEVLTAALRRALPSALLDGFSHVNPVFRCNRFEPGDENFHGHTDTPYYDAARHHVSRYTLIVYLTGGTGAPALRIGDAVALTTIAPMTAVLFDQSLHHEGAAYVDGRKVFLRTELVYEDAAVAHDPGIAALFAKATYLTGESVFAPELAAHAHEAYDRAARAHFGLGGVDGDAPAEVYVHKQFRGIHFVANGYDAWFPKGAVTLCEAAALTLLDLFNCKLGDVAFRKVCASEVVRGDGAPERWIPALLARYPDAPAEPVFGLLDPALLFPPPERGGRCCPDHSYPAFEPARSDDVNDVYSRAQQRARARIDAAAVVLMGQEIFLDPAKFAVDGSKIFVRAEAAVEPVNFASCWNFGGGPEDYVGTEVTLEALRLLVPPILYVEVDGCYHLMFDFFRNSWMVSHATQSVQVPRILDLSPEDVEEGGGGAYDEDDEDDEDDQDDQDDDGGGDGDDDEDWN